jgi:hypothetical protein
LSARSLRAERRTLVSSETVTASSPRRRAALRAERARALRLPALIALTEVILAAVTPTAVTLTSEMLGRRAERTSRELVELRTKAATRTSAGELTVAARLAAVHSL